MEQIFDIKLKVLATDSHQNESAKIQFNIIKLNFCHVGYNFYFERKKHNNNAQQRTSTKKLSLK